MELLTVDTLNEARQKLFQVAKELPLQRETVPLSVALGKVLAADVMAKRPLPDFRRSTVDGYAVVASDTQGATDSLPVFLTLTAPVLMGQEAAEDVVSGHCAYVPTGGMIPAGADAMIMVEYCERFDSRRLAVYKAVAPGKNVVEIGEDVATDHIVLRRGQRLRAQELGAAAAIGLTELTVFKPLTMTLISTGDELVNPGELICPGQVYDINSQAIAAQATGYGFEVLQSMVVADDEKLLSKTVQSALPSSDLVIISGGSSQGEKDATAEVFRQVADPGVFTHGIALKPGKPTIGGYDRPTSTLLLGLPGHPAAALLVFDLLIGWLWRQLTDSPQPPAVPAKLATNVAAAPGKTTCLPVRLQATADDYIAQPVWGKSGLITTLTEADGYLIIELNQEGLPAGAPVKVHLL